MHSMFGTHYMNVVDGACRDAGVRTYGLVRNAHAFAPPQPFVLYSDLYDHAEFIRGVTTSGFSGCSGRRNSGTPLRRRIISGGCRPWCFRRSCC